MKKLYLTAITMMMSATVFAQDFHFDEMTYSPEQTTFKLFAPNDAKCTVKVGKKKVKMTKTADCLWTATVKGDLKGQPYVFNTGHGDTPGVFAKAVGVNGQQAYVIDLATTNPEGWENDRRPVLKTPADLVIYEMHHRDFSISRSEAKYPGKFLALTEPWAINHLKALGINAVHILPSYDYGSVDETRLNEPQFNWGYDPVNYNVPEGSYSTDPYKPEVRIREFKQMVQALHKAGIRVILDVVYNHTYDIDRSNFQRTFPDYYYRKSGEWRTESGEFLPCKRPSAERATVPDGSPSGYSNGSGCGNETASERPMMRRFMIESVKYWINEYHIDGFRFDLMGIHDIQTMNEIRKAVDAIDPTIFIYGEGWSAGACAMPNELLAMKANIPQMPGIAAFCDDMRDALRGPFSDDTKCGWLGGSYDNKETESLKAGIVGMIAHPQIDYSKVNYSDKPYALEPTQMIAYVSCHDDMCLVDRLKTSIIDKENHKGNPTSQLSVLHSQLKDDLIRLDLLAQTAVFTSQGVPFILAGEELLRDKKGVHNSYNSPDSINQFDWQNKQRYPQVFQYYQGLIQLRRMHPAFRLGNADLVRKHLEFLDAPEGVVAFRLKNYAGRDSWRDIVVVLNSTTKEQQIAVPHAAYTVACANGIITLRNRGLDQFTGNKVSVAPRSALIMHD